MVAGSPGVTCGVEVEHPRIDLFAWTPRAALEPPRAPLVGYRPLADLVEAAFLIAHVWVLRSERSVSHRERVLVIAELGAVRFVAELVASEQHHELHLLGIGRHVDLDRRVKCVVLFVERSALPQRRGALRDAGPSGVAE